jgi:hypothetical protein
MFVCHRFLFVSFSINILRFDTNVELLLL